MSYREDLGTILRDGAEHLGESFTRPDEDWDMQMIVIGGDGSMNFVAIDNDYLATEMSKDFLGFTIMPGVIKKVNGQAVGTIASAWSVMADTPEEWEEFKKWREENPDSNLSEYPTHGEVVQIHAVDVEGVETWSAEIIRDGVNPPTLGEWKYLGPDTFMQGRFVGPILAALKDVAEKGE